ncbi:hypothetical protein A0J61_03031 [Choanephora cucurbitarum]|uniref:Uncharacterized protein n=1 Tax=Choanephora cucurbitarum TaxID=101091 RepID=A0A1C7NIF4_9FUNG|nr:hypothetical protein A0J61_03031 [Choanephora cucurbitarum]
MTDNPSDDTPQQEQPIMFTKEQAFELFKKWQQQSRQERETTSDARELPLDIQKILDETPTQELNQNIQQYKRQIQHYHHEEWTRGETTNKEFIQRLKHYQLDAYQMVTTTYKHADHCRITARAATELYEQQLLLLHNQASLSHDERNYL